MQFAMKTHVEFRSDMFPQYEGEEDEINPGRYGKRVAEFLVRGLKEKGFELIRPRRSMRCRKRSTNFSRRILKSELSDGGLTRNSTSRGR